MVYNFVPGDSYDYQVRQGPAGSFTYVCGGNLSPDPELPAGLAPFAPSTYSGSSFASEYILIDTGDCFTGNDYLVAIDPAIPAIVWYLDVGTYGNTNTGWRFQSASGSITDQILVTVDRQHLYSFDWEGTVLGQWDAGSSDCTGSSTAHGPCLSHDAFTSPATTHTYVLTSKEDSAGTYPVTSTTAWNTTSCATSHFVIDGYQEFHAFNAIPATVTTDEFLPDMDASLYDPTVDEGPRPPSPAGPNDCNAMYWRNYFDRPIDWTHVNSLTVAVRPGGSGDEVVDLSLKSWDHVLRYDVDTDAVLWTLNGSDASYSDTTLVGGAGATGFSDQHFVTNDNNHILMFDNTGASATAARAMHLVWANGTPPTATITHVWPIVDPVTGMGTKACATQGSAEFVVGSSRTSVVAACAAEKLVEELNATSGRVAALYVDGSVDFCGTDPDAYTDPDDIGGWARAFQTDHIGDY